jgi:hypothetical protein
VYSNGYSIERSRMKRSSMVSVLAFSHRLKLKLKKNYKCQERTIPVSFTSRSFLVHSHHPLYLWIEI